MRKGVIAKKAEGPRGPPSPSANGLPHVEAGEDSGQRLEPRKETTATKEGWEGRRPAEAGRTQLLVRVEAGGPEVVPRKRGSKRRENTQTTGDNDCPQIPGEPSTELQPSEASGFRIGTESFEHLS